MKGKSTSIHSSTIGTLAIELRPVASLKPYPRNARRHPPKQIRQIARSIEVFGFTNPILIDADGMVLAGHGRLEAAKRLNMSEVPTVRLDHLDDAAKRAYVLADNRLAEKAGWDDETLALELGQLAEMDIDLTLTGFDTAEIDKLLTPFFSDDEEEQEHKPDPGDDIVSVLGDLWLLGNHRLYCGDSTEAASYERLLGTERAQMVFTDGPYNVKIEGNVSGLGKTRHGEFVMASGEMSPAQFTQFLSTVCGHLVTYSTDGSLHFLFMDFRHLHELLNAAMPQFTELKNLLVWNKDNGGMGSLYRSKHELILLFKNGTAPHVNNIELGKHGRNRTNVWSYAGASSLRKGRAERLALHPTVKPVVMVADAMKDCSNVGDLVLDSFGGSGSTMLAAHKTGRRAALIELDPRYVDVTVQRVQRNTGLKAIHADTGLSFEETAVQRRGQRTAALGDSQ